MKKILCVALLVALPLFSAVVPSAVAQRADKADSDVQKSWDGAEVFVPGKTLSTTPNRVAVDRPSPVVIYLHGCTGIERESDVRWARFIQENGFIAVLPNSMARTGRKPNCDPKTKKSGLFPQAPAMRQEEIRFAVEQLKKCRWADNRNIFLMGHDEGGVAAARTRLDGFRGIIISGWHCTFRGRPDFDGIFAPLDTPLLTLEWSRDAWYAGTPRDGSCASKFGERKKARQVMLNGSWHNTSWEHEARDAVAQFLKENLAQ